MFTLCLNALMLFEETLSVCLFCMRVGRYLTTFQTFLTPALTLCTFTTMPSLDISVVNAGIHIILYVSLYLE